MPHVLVTGGARRIGAEIVRTLAARGWAVTIHCNASVAEGEALAEALRAAGGTAHVVTGDLSQADAPRRVVADAARAGGPLDALVNNASLFLYDTPSAFDPATFDLHIAVNLRAPALLSQAFAAQLPEGAAGSVVNLLDNRLYAPNPDYFTYALGKYGLLGMTEMHALAFAPRIRVNAVAPSIALISGEQSEESFRRAHTNNPLGRGVTPADVAAAVAWLLEAPAVTGEVIVVDGGQRLRRRGRDVAFGTEAAQP
ncbi:MAG: SDR family oxidoreductase [Acetobacteraceae bacterium]|nr:SDR family oxidoreductase [Acetobacteraceae bacterium]